MGRYDTDKEPLTGFSVGSLKVRLYFNKVLGRERAAKLFFHKSLKLINCVGVICQVRNTYDRIH